MEETKSKIIKVKSHATSFTSNASNISSQRIKEETKLAELEARKSVLKRKKQLEMAKLQLKLDEEELDIDTGIAVSHAKSEVLQKYENIPEEQSLNRFDFIENKEDSVGCPRQLIQNLRHERLSFNKKSGHRYHALWIQMPTPLFQDHTALIRKQSNKMRYKMLLTI